MRGTIDWQVREVFESIRAIGKSKHHAKETARANGFKTSTTIAANTGIFSYKTFDDYRQVAKECCNFIKDTFNIKDISKLTGDKVASFLEAKIEAGLSYKTITTYASALGKFESALNKYFDTDRYSFKSELNEARALISPDERQTRAFTNPMNVINSLSGINKIVAQLQYIQGLRVSEANYIRLEKQLDGNNLTVQGKGGYFITKELTGEQVKSLQDNAKNGIFKCDYDEYLKALKSACKNAGENYTGSHAFRHNYAQETLKHYIKEGFGILEAEKRTSEQLGHHRADVVKVYLR